MLPDDLLNLVVILILRFMTGVSLAGIYPVGMKIASDYYPSGLGVALGYLVGALVLGTAFPFILSVFSQDWRCVLLETCILAILSGVLMGNLKDAPGRIKRQNKTVDSNEIEEGGESSNVGFGAIKELFRDNRGFRAAAIGYCGHMWELYAFWAFVPAIWEDLINRSDYDWSPDLLSFLIISSGFPGCILSGYLCVYYGNSLVAYTSLIISMALCLCSPLFYELPLPLTFAVYVIWGITVVSDSPQFSTLIAQAVPPDVRGMALTIVNCVGFSVTTFSIQLLSVLEGNGVGGRWLFLFLAPGGVLGVGYRYLGWKK